MTVRLAFGVSIFSLLIACGGTGNGSGDGDGGTGGDGDGGGGGSCTSAEECGTGVCNPATGTCTDNLPCTTNTECGVGAHCDTGSGNCASSTTGDPCDTETQCTMNEGCVGGYCGCGGDEFIAEAVPPNMLILLDRSGSMDDNLGSATKYETAQTAIGNLLSTYGGTVRFGLAVYPSDNNCAAGTINVDIPGTTAAINTAISNNTPNNGLTPIGGILDSLDTYTPLQDTTRENYVLLITDGAETCSGDGVSAVTALAAQTPPVSTFVVGFGSGVDTAALNAMAQAGGTALAGGPPYYYQADDAASLNMALDAIGGAVLSCTYTLDMVPDSADFFVYFDDVPVTEDGSDGWTYDPVSNTVTFNGAACDSLRAGDVSDLVIVHNCPVVVP